jgi:hypothetical protein
MNNPNVKFGRQYIFKVETQPRVPGSNAPDDAAFATIRLPYACEFSVTRNLLASANTANFRILNLAERSRNKIYKDQYNLLEFRAVQFWAGYSDQPPMIFNGNVKQAWSFKQSGTKDVITEIEAYEGAYAMSNGFTNKTLAGGQPYAQVIQSLSKDLPFLDNPVVGDLPGNTKRGVTLFGNTWKAIQSYAKGGAVIDNNRVLALQNNECIEGDITVINSRTGLLGSPYRANAMIECEMLFTPQLKIAQIVKLESEVNTLLNGFYKVAGIQHNGVISETSSGAARTIVQLWLGTEALTTISR